MKPLIGITSGAIYNHQHPHEPFSYGQIHEYATAISQAGGIPVVLPISQDADETKEIFSHLEGIVFAGGSDVSPNLYGQKIQYAIDIDEVRDHFEIELMQLALDAQMPVLGICRGMQLLNVAFGGTLYQDIARQIPDADSHLGYLAVDNPAHLVHTLAIVPGSKLATILGATKIKSNSRHHQAVKKVGSGLVVNARSSDGVIEGIEALGRSCVIGVQPHPESLVKQAQPSWSLLFDSFVLAARK